MKKILVISLCCIALLQVACSQQSTAPSTAPAAPEAGPEAPEVTSDSENVDIVFEAEEETVEEADSNESTEVRTIIYAANDSRLFHNIGSLIDGKWVQAPTASTTYNYLVYGPFATDWGSGKGRATFEITIDDVSKDDEIIAKLAVFDETRRETLTLHDLHRSEIATAGAVSNIALDFNLANRANHQIQLLVYWMNNSKMSIGNIKVELP